ncbi:MAG: hypothetical protein WC455_09245 [Dehalococcoidia bacterium]
MNLHEAQNLVPGTVVTPILKVPAGGECPEDMTGSRDVPAGERLQFVALIPKPKIMQKLSNKDSFEVVLYCRSLDKDWEGLKVWVDVSNAKVVNDEKATSKFLPILQYIASKKGQEIEISFIKEAYRLTDVDISSLLRYANMDIRTLCYARQEKCLMDTGALKKWLKSQQ